MPTEPTGDPARAETRPPGDDPQARSRSEADAWGAFGLVVSGVTVWGGVGFLVGEWLDNPLPRVIGLLVGMAAGLYLVWFRYGAPTGTPAPTPGRKTETGPTGRGPADAGRTP